jgi:hypothetical protein
MKKILFLLLVVSTLSFAQNYLIGGTVQSYYLKGTPALGATYTNDTFDSSKAFNFGNCSRLELRLKSLDSTFVVISLWQKLDSKTAAATWVALDSITVHPTSGAGADTVWTLRSAVADVIKFTNAQYQFQYRFASSGNWATQATAASYRVWLNFVGH